MPDAAVRATRLADSLVRRRAINRLDERLREAGWLSILSLRLVPIVPFAAINYAAGASGVPDPHPSLQNLGQACSPGTAAVVILGRRVRRWQRC